MTDTTSFDLLTRRKKGWKAEAVLVVSPYVESEFFHRLARDLKPKRLHVVIDDGCRREDRDTVLQAVAAGGYKGVPHFKLGSARGLVHIKLFYIRWRTPGGRTAHNLIFGSANASRQGFSGEHNAELVADATLTATAHGDIITWCDKVMTATREAGEETVKAARDVALSKTLRLRLPAITIGRKRSEVSDFDLWIQRGALLSAYRPDPSFLRVVLPLGRALPPGDQARRATGAGFDVALTRSVRYNYIQDGLEEADDGAESDPSDLGNWRRKFFTWTQIGEWCSEGCERDHRADFRRRHHEQRAEALVRLEALQDPGARGVLCDTFLDGVESLWAAFGDEAPEFLQGRKCLDRPHYAGLFNDRVARDLDWIADNEFRERYVAGFEVVSVPRFRDDLAGWRSFVDSLCRQLVLDNQRERNQSRLLLAIREAVDAVGSDEDPLQDANRAVRFLRDLFERPDKAARSAVKTLQAYHQL